MSTVLDPASQTTPPPGSADQGNPNPPPAADWKSALPEELRSNKVFEAIKGKDWAEAGPILAKSYVHAQSMVGADKVILPSKDATPEQLAEFYTRLGRPPAPKDYEVKLPDGYNKDQLDAKRMETWQKTLHDLGLPKAQAEKLISSYLSEELAGRTAMAETDKKMRTDWEMMTKAEFGARYDERVNHAHWAVKEYDKTGKLIALLNETGLGSHPEVVRFFADVGQAMSSDSARGSGSGRGGAVTSVADAQVALDAFNRDQEVYKILHDPNHPMHEQTVKDRERLYTMAFPPTKR